MASDFHVLAPDFRGYGDSERKAIDATRGIADLSDDVVALLDTLEIEGPVDLLGWSAGGNVVIRKFENAAEILQLPEQAIFNCTGLGAGKLFDDPELIPIKGQLSFLMPQPGVDYNLLGGNQYMFVRSDGIALGGTYSKNEWDTAVDPVVRDRMIAGHQRMFDGMRRLQGSTTHPNS